MAFGMRDEELAYRALRTLERFTRPIGGLPGGTSHHAGARSERVASEEAHVPAVQAMAAHPSSLRIQLIGLRLISNLTDSSEAKVGSGSANRAQLLVDVDAIDAILAALWSHSADSGDVSFAGCWALHGLCHGDTPPARERARQAAEEGSLVALCSVMRSVTPALSSVAEAGRQAISAIVGKEGFEFHDEIRSAAEAAGVRSEWIAR